MTASSAYNRKGHLISAIQDIQDEQELTAIEEYLKLLRAKRKHVGIIQPLRDSISVEEMKTEQHYQGFNRPKIDVLATELDIQEPLEELLEMLD